MWSLLELFPDEFLLNILDVGAALNDLPPYQSLVDRGRARIIGFEPNQDECEKLNRQYGKSHRFFPSFVGDGNPATFHETNWVLTGSLYPPNSPLLEKFQNLSEVVRPVAMHTVTTTRIDDIAEIDDVDFFKIDVQGSELVVFQNALRSLASALVIQTEVEFVELYKGQPLFADVDIFLRSKGFQFHAFNGFGSRAFKPLVVNGNINAGIRQALWSDALYVRDWMHLETLDELKLRKYAVLAHDVVKSPDLANLVLMALDHKIGSDFAVTYRQRLMGRTMPVAVKSNAILRKPPAVTLTIADNVKIVVPDTLDLITPYVLREQQDWFEDEIKFLRRLLRPGNQVIDIGANYGVYTLSMASTIGPSGRVWAFEPASTTAAMLEAGIDTNGFTNILLEQSAVSSCCGTAKLSLNTDSELNALVSNNASVDASEVVPLVTLDDCMARYGWMNIDFLKIDAEGEEVKIVKGGEQFFSKLSPLIQYEIKAGRTLNMALVPLFAERGFASFRLVPGLDLLIPFDPATPSDAFLLNLFCCKQDRVDQLVADGFLLDSEGMRAEALTASGRFTSNDATRNAYSWRNTIAKMPYGARLADRWEATMADGRNTEVEVALSHYAMSQDLSLTRSKRFGSLQASFGLLQAICERQPSFLRLASLARVAQDIGARQIAVDALMQLGGNVINKKLLDFSEPFLAPEARFDDIPPGYAIDDWIEASVREKLERLRAFSSFYTKTSTRQHLERIRSLGFGSAEMERRLELLQARFDPVVE